MCESVPQLRYHNPHLRVVVNTRAAEDAPQSIKFKTGGVGVGGTPQSISVGLYNCCAHCVCVCVCVRVCHEAVTGGLFSSLLVCVLVCR